MQIDSSYTPKTNTGMRNNAISQIRRGLIQGCLTEVPYFGVHTCVQRKDPHSCIPQAVSLGEHISTSVLPVHIIGQNKTVNALLQWNTQHRCSHTGITKDTREEGVWLNSVAVNYAKQKQRKKTPATICISRAFLPRFWAEWNLETLRRYS